jgi:hypothetical protein
VSAARWALAAAAVAGTAQVAARVAPPGWRFTVRTSLAHPCYQPRHVGTPGRFPHAPLSGLTCPWCIGARRWWRANGVRL